MIIDTSAPEGDAFAIIVDCGYDMDGNLVGIQIWDDVRKRPNRKELSSD